MSRRKNKKTKVKTVKTNDKNIVVVNKTGPVSLLTDIEYIQRETHNNELDYLTVDNHGMIYKSLSPKLEDILAGMC